MIQIQRYKIYTVSLLATFLLSICAPTAFSAEMYFDSSSHSFGVGDEFLVNLFIDTKNESINAIQGSLVVPSSLDVKEIRVGDSRINFWIDKPVFKDGVVTFSGITPGGFSGEKLPILSVVFVGKNIGSGSLAVSNLIVLKNDGNGTDTKSKSSTFSFNISKDSVGTVKIPAIIDRVFPEGFDISVSEDPNIFDGRHFLVFATQDKDSGINHYDIKEGWFGKYTLANSPYLLHDQSLRSRLSVRAIDNAGNFRTVVLYPQPAVHLYELYAIFGILVLVFGLVFFRKKDGQNL
jgi:hypothetical protein